ncbi:MAG TPA: hypothetical protein EYQ42_08775 [Thiotrichaceae bacterium]|jgi:hypothetical protein|nr:hypothetical protein [Thiotrichaceae bacterium]HIM08186.1 hypothetical protein [Gammaproteobacteria bacterium]
MKNCPYCEQEVENDAVRCMFCNGALDKFTEPETKWYFSTTAVVISLLSFGPFALPLVWIHPAYKMVTKIVLTIIVIGLSIWLYYILKEVYEMSMEQLAVLGIVL